MAKKKNVDALVNAKLTRSEVIDMMIQEALLNLRAESNSLRKEMEELNSLTRDEVIDAIGQQCRLNLDVWYQRDLSIHIHNPIATPALLKRMKRAEQLREECQRVESAIGALSDTKQARLHILKESLQKSEEGLELLSKIKSFSLGLGDRLLLAAGK